MHPLKKAFFVALGCISLALGTIGIALPILPTVPFYLLTAFCFANSSERLHTWFTHTTVYKKYIGSYFRRRGMTRKAKALLIGTVTAIMLPGFILMDKVPVGRAIMAIVWAGHIVYFGFKVQTITQQEADLLVLDEAGSAWELDMVDKDLLRRAVLQRPAGQECVLTAHAAPQWMLDAADYVTEMKCIRHPYQKGIAARKGVEY